MKSIYTEAAQKELEDFKSRQVAMLEEIVAEKKVVLGDDVLEITASDIKEASSCIRAIRPTIKRMQATDLLTRAYIILGVLMMLGSFFYSQISEIITENKTQATLFMLGASMSIVGWIFRSWVDYRKKRFEDEAYKYMEFRKFSRSIADVQKSIKNGS